MQLLELTLPTIDANLALDEALLLEAESGHGGEVLRFWEWTEHAVILGAGCRVAEDVDDATCRKDDVPIRRRSSGGGTVLLGKGCLLYSLVLSYDHAPELREIRPSYRWILERLRGTLSEVQPGIEVAGVSDLCWEGRKFSGNSQQRKRACLLHHGTVLYAFDISRIGRYLRLPVRQPEYRRLRSHRDFLVNLPLDRSRVKERIKHAWQADQPRSDWPDAMVHRLLADKYARLTWHRRL